MIFPRNLAGLEFTLVVDLSPRLKHLSGMLAFPEKQNDTHFSDFNTKSREVQCCWMELRVD